MADTEPTNPSLTLALAPKSGRDQLIPEEAAAFDLVLRNETTTVQSVFSLEMNQLTPLVRAYEADGALIVQATPLDAQARVTGEGGEPRIKPPRLVDLAPTEEQTTWINLWSYTSALPPGRYEIEVEHHLTPPVSGRLPFEIVSAEIHACAVSYEAVSRMATLLAWIATPAAGAPQLYSRLSGFGDHTSLQQGAFAFQAVSAAARLAVSLTATPVASWFHWIAVVTGSDVQLFRSNMAFLDWTSEPIALPLADVTPVPRFPERGHAVFLATGQKDGAAALAGTVVAKAGPAPTVWTVALSADVLLSACVFGTSGDITLLLVSDDGQSATLSLLTVDESGAVVSPEQTIRTTPNAVAAVVADLRFNAPPSFVVLEADRQAPDRVAHYRIALPFAPFDVPDLGELPGWPKVSGQARAPKEIVLEIGMLGDPTIAMIDERGWLYGGSLTGSLDVLRKDSVSAYAHVAAMSDHKHVSAFTETGALYHGRAS